MVEARKQFDTIIIDTPPLLAVTDAVTVAVRSDGLLLCVRAGRATRESLQRCSQQLHRAGVPVLGSVFNAYRARSGSYGGRYGAYGDMYGVYGHAEPELKDDVA